MKKSFVLKLTLAFALIFTTFSTHLAFKPVTAAKSTKANFESVSYSQLLVLSHLAYVDFSPKFNQKTLKEVSTDSNYKKIYNEATKDSKGYSPTKKDVQNIKNAFTSVQDFIHIDSYHDKKTGLGYSVFKKNDAIIISFRGTDDFTDITEDILFVSEPLDGINSPQVDQALKVVATYLKKYKGAKFYFTGHSLGGYLAQCAAYMVGENKLHSISKGLPKDYSNMFYNMTTFNAPGIFKTAKLGKKYEEKYSYTNNYIIGEDFVGYSYLPLGDREKLNKERAHSIRFFYLYIN